MAYNFKSVKILVVESAPELFELLRGVLSMFTVPDVNIYGAYTIEEGFKLFTEHQFDMVIVDWLQTPDRGIALTKQIRTSEKSPNPFVPIIMTAGSGHHNRVVRARDAGVSEYLVKPFTAKTLARKIERIIEFPRPFVVCDTYVGPDRRVGLGGYDGPDRRKQAPKERSVSFAQQ